MAAGSWGGFVFVHLGKDPAPLDSAIGERTERYRRYGFADLRIGRRIVLDVAANWKLLAENFSECFHCPPVHPEFCRIVTAYQDAGAWGLRGGAEAKPEYKAGAQTLTLDGTARLPAFGGLNEEERARLYAADMVLPNLFLNVHPDYVNSQLMFPTGPQSVRMVYDWLFEPAPPAARRSRPAALRGALGHHQPAGRAQLRMAAAGPAVARVPPRRVRAAGIRRAPLRGVGARRPGSQRTSSAISQTMRPSAQTTPMVAPRRA